MCTCVKEYPGARLSCTQVFHHAIEVEVACIRLVVPVFLDIEAEFFLENWNVIRPCWRAEPHRTWRELLDEFAEKSEGA